MDRIVNGNKVYYDDVRGRWNVLFTATNTRTQYASETEALAAASATPGTIKETGAGVIPKQAVDNGLSKKSNAVKRLDTQVQASITTRVASEGSVLNATVGNEKDGFTSLTAATTKGSANEGPAIAVMGANIKQGNVTKTVSASAKLNSVTGGTKGTSAVLNETVVQASPKGIAKALKTVVKLNDKQVEVAVQESSPIPAKAKDAVKVELQGGVAVKAGNEAQAASIKVSAEIKKPFGSQNPFGSIGSAFGNIMAQITTISSSGAGFYNDPLRSIKASATTSMIDATGSVITTPNIMNSNGTTNLSISVTKSKIENANIKLLPNTVKPGERTNGFTGITTKLRGYSTNITLNVTDEEKELARKQAVDDGVAEGGSYLLPIINNGEELKGEFRALERPITTLIIRHRNKGGSYFHAEQMHVLYRQLMIKDFGASAVNSNPFDYVFPGHMYINDIGNVKIMTPFKYELPLTPGKKDYIPNSLTIYIDGSGDSKMPVTSDQFEVLALFCSYFLDVFPGGEILGLKDFSTAQRHRNNPFFNVRDFVKQKFVKDSVTEENEPAVVPAPADLADATPKNVVLPPKPHVVNRRPSVSKVATTENKINLNLTVTQYQKGQTDALDFIKQKKTSISIADLSTGSGLTSSLGSSAARLSAGTSLSSSIPGLTNALVSNAVGGIFGSVLGNVAGGIASSIIRSDNASSGLISSTQEFKMNQLSLGKVFDTVKGVFK